MFLLLFLAAFCYASQEANDTAIKLLELYGNALRETNFNELNSLLDEKYEFYPCDKTIQPLNREQILETVKLLPYKTIKLSNRTLMDATFSDDDKEIRIRVNLGGYTSTVMDAKLKDDRWVIDYEEQNACNRDPTITYMIDYNQTAHHTARGILDTLVGWTRNTEGKFLVNALYSQFHLSYYQKDAPNDHRTLTLSMENWEENRGDYDKEVMQGIVRVEDAVLWPNRSITFRLNSGRYNYKSAFISSPFEFNVGGWRWERHLLTHQFIQEPLDIEPVDLKFQQLQYWNIEKEEGETWI